jgi:hypothetical protein
MPLTMKLRSLLVPFAIVSIAASAFAADKNIFVLVSSADGKTIGKASYSIEKAKDGFKVHTQFQYRMSTALIPKRPDPTPASGRPYRPASMLEGQYAGEYKVDAQGNYITGYLQDASTTATISYTPDKARTEITVSEMSSGSVGDTHSMTSPSPNYIFLPAFDAGPVQLLLTSALAHPESKEPYMLLVPSGAMGPDQLLLVSIAPATDTRTGTLDGKPVTLKHFILLFHAGRAEAFVDETGSLMEVQFAPIGVDYVRAKFVLTP